MPYSSTVPSTGKTSTDDGEVSRWVEPLRALRWNESGQRGRTIAGSGRSKLGKDSGDQPSSHAGLGTAGLRL